MGKVLSFLSWIVENFHNQQSRVNDVVDQITLEDPDFFGMYEVTGAAVFQAMITKMPATRSLLQKALVYRRFWWEFGIT